MNNRAWPLLLLIGGCASTPPPAQHESPDTRCLQVEVGTGPYDFDLDAAAMKFAERCVNAPHGASIVKGFIQFVGAGSEGTTPVAAALVELRASSPRAGFTALVAPQYPGKVSFFLADERSHRPAVKFGEVPFSDERIPFELRFDDAGLVQVFVQGQTKAISVDPFEPTRVRLVSSSAHVRFSNIEVTTSNR